jgi:hypothetical protein
MRNDLPISPNKNFKYSISVESWDEDSLEVGETDDRGYVVEDAVEEIGDILLQANTTYGIYMPFAFGRWESTQPDEDADFYEKGISKFYTLYITNEDGSEITDEENDFITFLLSDGRYEINKFRDYAVGGIVLGAIALGVGTLITYFYFKDKKGNESSFGNGDSNSRAKSVTHTINGVDRKYPIKDAWKKEHTLENKSQDFEVPQGDRKPVKYEMGGDASEHYHEVEYGEGGVARAKEIIMNKIGLNEENADFITTQSEKFAIWLADSIVKLSTNSNLYGTKSETIKELNKSPYLITQLRQRIRGILDWLENPNTPKQNLRELTFVQAEEKSKQWHDELIVSGGDIDYVEPKENKILKTYPTNEYGKKYYWVMLPSNICDLESSRMGHCGKSDYSDNLISFRSTFNNVNGEEINDSHITIGYGNGLFYQVKGKQNKKPLEKYFPYIFDFIKSLVKSEIEDLPFNGFASEYASKEDYGWEDMTKQELTELYELNPNLFSDFAGKYMLYEAGLSVERPNTTIVIEKSPEYVADLLKLDRDLSDEVVEKVLTGETDDWFNGSDSYSYYYENAGDYVDNLYEKNYEKVIDKIVELTGFDKSVVKENGAKYYLSGDDEEFDRDTFEDISRSIANAMSSAEENAYVNYYYQEIKSSLSELGTIKELNYDGLIIEIDLSNLMSISAISSYLKDLETEHLEDVFFEAENQGDIEFPNLSIDDRYSAYPEDDDFNENFDIDNYEKGGSIRVNKNKKTKIKNMKPSQRKLEKGGALGVSKEDYYLVVNNWVYFTFNYPMGFVKDAFNSEHLRGKFSSSYERYGSVGAVMNFWANLDGGNQEILALWIKNNYFNSNKEKLKSISNENYANIITHWTMFCFNFPYKFYESVFDSKHFVEKWSMAYERAGATGVVNKFFTELSGDNQRKLTDWVYDNYEGSKFADGGGVELTRGDIEDKIQGLRLRIAKTKKQVSSYESTNRGKYNKLWQEKVVPLQKELDDLSELWGKSKYADGGVLENNINELYKKSNFINDDFTWTTKLLEMLQDNSIEAYDIYQSLTEEQKEQVLNELYSMDNDMGSYGDGDIETSKENLMIILDDARNGKKYADGGRVTTNDGIIESFLMSNKQLKVGNLSTHFSEYNNEMLLRNYGTLIATRKGNDVHITNTKYSITTSKITNKVRNMAINNRMNVSYVDTFEKGGSANEMWNGEYLTITADKNKMVIKLTDEGIEEVNEMREENKSDSQIMYELFEDINANSELIYHDDLGESGFGLTSASGVTDGYYLSDNGDEYEEAGKDARLYYFNDYMLRSEIDDLLNGELVLSGSANKYAKGGKTGRRKSKKVEPKVARTQFEEETYEYAEGGLVVKNNSDLEEVAKYMTNAIKKHRWDLKDLIYYFEKDNNFDYKHRVKIYEDMNGYEMPKTYKNIYEMLKRITEANGQKFADGGEAGNDFNYYDGAGARTVYELSLPQLETQLRITKPNETERIELIKKLIEQKSKKFADGGAVDLEYSEILNVLKSKIDDAIDEIPNSFENAYSFTGEEVEHESRDGFIPYTDGGYEARWFEYLSGMFGQGYDLPTKQLTDEMNRQIDYNLKVAKDNFIDNYPEIVEKLGEENIDYNSLYDAGYGEEAEELSNDENEMMSEDTIMMRIMAHYYAPDNYKGVDGKHTIRLFGDVNLESPYHRTGNLDDSYEVEFTFDSIDELETEMAIGIAKVIAWFEGSMYNDSDAEMKVRRMAKGGGLGNIGKPYSFDVIATKKSGEKIKELRVAYAENKEIAQENLLEFLKNKLHYTGINIIAGREGHEKISRMAKGGGVKKRSLMSVAHLVDWKGEGIKKWYTRSYPTDELGEEMNDTNTFKDLWDGIHNGVNVYEIIGVGDSVIRERLFEYLSLIYDVNYSYVYDKWLASDEYARGGFVSKAELVWKKLSSAEKMKFLSENFTPQITPRSQEILVGKAYNFLPKNVKITLASKYANVEEYASGGRVKVGVFDENQLRNKEDKKAVEKAQKETGLNYVDTKIIKKGGKMLLEVYLIPNEEYYNSNKFAKGGSVKAIKKKAEKLLEDSIDYRFKRTSMGSGWLFQLESPLNRNVFNLLEEELYLDEFSPDDMGIEDYDELSKEEQDYYYEEWKEEIFQNSFEDFKEKCKKHLDDFIEYLQKDSDKEYAKGGEIEFKRGKGRGVVKEVYFKGAIRPSFYVSYDNDENDIKKGLKSWCETHNYNYNDIVKVKYAEGGEAGGILKLYLKDEFSEKDSELIDEAIENGDIDTTDIKEDFMGYVYDRIDKEYKDEFETEDIWEYTDEQYENLLTHKENYKKLISFLKNDDEYAKGGEAGRKSKKSAIKLYYHQTSGGAEYLSSSKVKGTKDEGSMDSEYIVRIDGAKDFGGELVIEEEEEEYAEGGEADTEPYAKRLYSATSWVKITKFLNKKYSEEETYLILRSKLMRYPEKQTYAGFVEFFEKYEEKFDDFLEEVEEEYAKGGKVRKKKSKKVEPKVARTQFEEETYEYAEGGEVSEWMEEALASLIEETGNEDLDITMVSNSGNEFFAGNDMEEYRVFKSEDDAELTAEDEVREDMEETPENFNKDFIKPYIDGADFFREAIREMNESYANDIESEDDNIYANRLIAEMVENGLISDDDALSGNAEELAEYYKDDFVTLMTEEKMEEGNDGLDYFISNFGEEETMKMVIDNNLIDIFKASRDAVQTDGVAHFLSHYDGETLYLSDGYVAYRIN